MVHVISAELGVSFGEGSAFSSPTFRTFVFGAAIISSVFFPPFGAARVRFRRLVAFQLITPSNRQLVAKTTARAILRRKMLANCKSPALAHATGLSVGMEIRTGVYHTTRVVAARVVAVGAQRVLDVAFFVEMRTCSRSAQPFVIERAGAVLFAAF